MKKFFDIIPPSKNKDSSQKREFDYNKTREKKKFLSDLPLSEPAERQSFWQGEKAVLKTVRKTLFFCLFFLILTGIFSFFVFSKIKIEIWPKTKISDFETNVIVKIGSSKSDFQRKIISGKLFENQKSASKEFSASGKAIKERKAEGIIRVFNNYSSSAQGLLPNTRFVSDKGKLFRSTKREVIPGGHRVKGKFIAGFADIKVRAAEAGEDYNIGPSTFSIPGFKGTPKYTYFYGKSSSPMAGGFRGEVSQVTERDIEKAKSTLSGKLKEESKNFLKKTVPADYVLLDEAIFQDITEGNNSAKAGSEAKSFNLQVKVKSQGIGFKKSDMNKFVQEFIASNISEDEEFQKDSLEVNYSLGSSFSQGGGNIADILKSGEIALAVKIKAKVYKKIDLIKLKKALSDKPLREAMTFLKDLPYITKVKNKSWLFLKKKIPDDINKIELELNFNLSP
jgi:hypothetical protein